MTSYQEVCEHEERFFACTTCWPVSPELAPAFRGLAGTFVRSFAVRSEAHPVALLGTFLALAGNQFGPGAYARVGSTRHPARLNFVVVAPTSAGRKGVSWSEASSVFETAFPGWQDFVYKGFGSGEGLIARVAERMAEDSPDFDAIRDPRMVIFESEFASILRVAARDGSILSPIVRDAWDGTPLQNNVKRDKRLVAPAGHMVSLVAHITPDELRREMTRTDIANGFGNRFLFGSSQRPRLIALPEDDFDPTPIAEDLREAVKQAAGKGHLRFTDAGADAWRLVYDRLEHDAENAGGMVGPLIARGSAQTLRLSLAYALLDRAGSIGADHVEAAFSLWSYCARSVRDIFGSAVGNPLADRIADALGGAPAGLTRTEISAVLGRNYSAEQIDVAVGELIATGRFRTVEEPTGGRPVTWLRRNETSERNETR